LTYRRSFSGYPTITTTTRYNCVVCNWLTGGLSLATLRSQLMTSGKLITDNTVISGSNCDRRVAREWPPVSQLRNNWWFHVIYWRFYIGYKEATWGVRFTKNIRPTNVLYLFKWKVHSGGRNIYLEEHKQIHLKGFISLAIKYSIKHDQHKMMMSQYVGHDIPKNNLLTWC
jgi:hypothetical protein